MMASNHKQKEELTVNGRKVVLQMTEIDHNMMYVHRTVENILDQLGKKVLLSILPFSLFIYAL